MADGKKKITKAAGNSSGESKTPAKKSLAGTRTKVEPGAKSTAGAKATAGASANKDE